MASVREWQFKRKFRTNAYGWPHTGFALTQCSRMKEHSGASPSLDFDVR